MFWLLHAELGEPVVAAGMDVSAAKVGWDCSFLPQALQMLLGLCLPNDSFKYWQQLDSPKEKGKKPLTIFWNKPAARMLKTWRSGCINVTDPGQGYKECLTPELLAWTVVFLSVCLSSDFKSLVPFCSKWKMYFVFLQEPSKVLFKKLTICQGGIPEELWNLACHSKWPLYLSPWAAAQ